MKRIALALFALFAFGASAIAQPVPNPLLGNMQYGAYNAAPPTCVSGTGCIFQTDVNGNLLVAGTFSATLAGFTPNGNYGTLTSTAASSGSTAMPGGAVVAFQNTSTIDVSCVLSAGAATATTNKIVVRGGATMFLTVGSNVNAACINQTGSASNVIVMAGGAGLGSNYGGSSGGGGGAITAASGSYASGALSSGSVASGAMVDLGSQADAACGTATGTCSLIALQKYNNTATGSAVPAGTNTIGTVGQLPYPVGATPYTATATGTTGATTATLAGASSVTTYLCGFSIRANATAAATGNATVTGVITATLNFTQWTAPNASGLGITEMIFAPCIPASGTNQSVAVVSAAPGTGGVVSVTAWGYKL